MSDATQWLAAVEQGDPRAAGQLRELVCDELRRLATYKMAQEAPGQTLQPTALVHEAWLRLLGAEEQRFEDRAHFLSAAPEAMRRILIDRARRRQTLQHGGRHERVEIEACNPAAPDDDDQLLAMNEALERLALEHPAQAQVVMLRNSGGMTTEETAQALDLSVPTVKNHWALARAWLLDAIRGR